MNRSSQSAIKHKADRTAMPDHAASVDELDYEAIEQAVMQTPRGRWFLSEYLRRHQNDETRRLAAALRRLANAQERMLIPAREASALEGLRLLLARTADSLALPGEERTLPEAAASRLHEQLASAAHDPDKAMIACEILSDCLAQLARLLGEPLPQSLPQPPQADEEEDPAAFPRAGAPSTSPATPAPSPSAPVHPAENPPAPEETLERRIVIRRRPRSGDVSIPLPEEEAGQEHSLPNRKTADGTGAEEQALPRRKVRINIRKRA